LHGVYTTGVVILAAGQANLTRPTKKHQIHIIGAINIQPKMKRIIPVKPCFTARWNSVTAPVITNTKNNRSSTPATTRKVDSSKLAALLIIDSIGALYAERAGTANSSAPNDCP